MRPTPSHALHVLRVHAFPAGDPRGKVGPTHRLRTTAPSLSFTMSGGTFPFRSRFPWPLSEGTLLFVVTFLGLPRYPWMGEARGDYAMGVCSRCGLLHSSRATRGAAIPEDAAAARLSFQATIRLQLVISLLAHVSTWSRVELRDRSLPRSSRLASLPPSLPDTTLLQHLSTSLSGRRASFRASRQLRNGGRIYTSRGVWMP